MTDKKPNLANQDSASDSADDVAAQPQTLLVGGAEPVSESPSEEGWRSRDNPLRYAISILILAIGAGIAFGLSQLAKPPENQDSTVLIQQVELETAQAYAGQLELTVSGTVVPHSEIDVAVEVSGRVKKKHADCQAGNFVKKGTTLVEIDTEEYDIELRRLEADVDQAEKRIQETDQQIVGEKKNLALAEQDFAIQQREYQRNMKLKDVLSRTELDQSRRGLNTAKTQVTARSNAIDSLNATRTRLQSALELSRRQLDKANLQLRRTIVTAPVDGVIVSELVQENDYVRQGDQIITFEDTSKSEVRCNLTTTDLSWIRANSKPVGGEPLSVYKLPKTDVLIYDSARPGIQWKGTLERFDGIGRDPVTKTIPCRIIVDEPVVETSDGPLALVRGMFVKCRMEVQASASEESNNLVSFSELALHPNNQVWFVEDNKLNYAAVKVVDRTQRSSDSKAPATIIVRPLSDKLNSGSRVVVSPLSQPTVGAPVLVTGEEEIHDVDHSAKPGSTDDSELSKPKTTDQDIDA